MVKLYKGDVIWISAPDGKGGYKERPVIVFKDAPKDSTVVSVYCTSQNNGDDANNIFVPKASQEAKDMGIPKDTWIRPLDIRIVDSRQIHRILGKCSLMQEIQRIVDKGMAK